MRLTDKIKDILKEDYENPQTKFIGRWMPNSGIIWGKCDTCHSRFLFYNIRFQINYGNYIICNKCSLLIYQYCKEQDIEYKLPCYHCRGTKYIDEMHCHYCNGSGLENKKDEISEQTEISKPISIKSILIKNHDCGDENIIDERVMGKDGIICNKCNKVLKW